MHVDVVVEEPLELVDADFSTVLHTSHHIEQGAGQWPPAQPIHTFDRCGCARRCIDLLELELIIEVTAHVVLLKDIQESLGLTLRHTHTYIHDHINTISISDWHLKAPIHTSGSLVTIPSLAHSP